MNLKSIFSAIANFFKSSGQKQLDAAKPQIKAQIDQVADRLAAQIDANVQPEPIYNALHDAIAALKLPSALDYAIDYAIHTVQIDPSATGAAGKAALYAEAARIKAQIDRARL